MLEPHHLFTDTLVAAVAADLAHASMAMRCPQAASLMPKFNLDRKTALAWIMLGLGILASVFAGQQVKQAIEQDTATQFAFECDQVTLKIQERLGAYALILRGAAGLFAASATVGRDQWRAYVETLRANRSVPGVQGIGFAKIIPREQLADHIARIRGEGFPDYNVRPPGERAVYTSIIYLEPFRDRNLRAFGYDMYTEPVRRAAMEQARDTGVAALSGKVRLVQETSVEVQAGTLMYVPVYRNGAAVDTIEKRRAALIGWAYSPYRMNDLMTGILGNWESRQGKTIDLTIYDDGQVLPAGQLFDSQSGSTPDVHSPFHQQRMLDFNGRHWLLVFDRTATAPGIAYAPAWVTLAGGLVLSGLLFWLMRAVINTRANAIRIADGLTAEIRQSQKLLRKSHEQILLLLDSAAEGIYGIDLNGHCTFCNSACLQLLGYQHPSDLLGKNMHWLIHAKRTDGTPFPVEECSVLQVLKTRETVHVDDEVFWRRDGTAFPVEYWSARQSHDGAITGGVVSFLDLTERQRLERLLARSRNVLLTVIDNIPLRVFWKDRDLRYLGCNNAFARDAGMKHPQDLIGKDDYRMGWSSQAERYRADDLAIMDSGIARLSYDEPQTTPGGQTIWLRTSKVPLRNQVGEVFGVLGVYEDITQIKRMQDTLARRESEMRTTLYGIGDAVISVGIGGGVLLMNPVAEKLTGWSESEAHGKPLDDVCFFIDEETGSRIDNPIALMFSRASTTGITTYALLIARDGTERPVRGTASPIFNQDQIIGAVLVFHDLSKEKEIQNKLMMCENLAVMGRLVADVSHELNNPLAIVIGRTELILRHCDKLSPTSLKDKLEIVLQTARRCQTILNGLLAYSGTIGKKEGVVNLPEVIQTAIDAVTYQYGMNDITVAIICNVPADIEIPGTPDALLSVFVNLIRNSRQAMAKTGSLTITAALENEGLLRIVICDTGIGISKDKLTTIFQPFRSGWQEGEGIGLGLATSLGIIEAHGGKLWIESEGDGHGTQLTMLLPYRKRRENEQATQAVDKPEE